MNSTGFDFYGGENAIFASTQASNNTVNSGIANKYELLSVATPLKQHFGFKILLWGGLNYFLLSRRYNSHNVLQNIHQNSVENVSVNLGKFQPQGLQVVIVPTFDILFACKT